MPRSPSPSLSPSPSPERTYPARRRAGVLPSRCRSPSPPPRRSLRPRRAAAASSRPLVDDFFPFPSSPSSSPPRPQHRRAPSPEPSSSDSDGSAVAGSSASDRRRRKLKLVVKLSQLPPDQQQRRAPPPPPFSDSSDGDDQPAADRTRGEEQVKPPKKRRIELRDDRSRNNEGAGRSDAASAPRTKRLPVPGMARTTPLPDRQTLDMILDKLQKKDTYGVFAEPVDLEELPDYGDVIEHPMDFGTVKRKLARNAYRSFEQFEDDVFLICSNAMLYNAPDTVYFRQAHSIQELARKKFQELRDEGIPTENQVKSEQKVKPIPSNRGPVKKTVLTYSDDDLDFLIRKEQIKRPIAKISGDDMSFKDQVKKPVSRNSENISSFHKERVTKPIFRNSENDLSSSFHKEHVKKPLSRNSEDDRSSSFRQVKVRKAISRNSEDDRSSSLHHVRVKKDISRSSENERSSSLPIQKVKKPTPRISKDDLSSRKTLIRKPVCRKGEEPDCSSRTDAFENPVCKKGEDLSLSPEKLVEEPICRSGDDLGNSSQKESPRQPICKDEQADLGYSCDEEIVKKPDCMDSQDALGSNVSPETIVSAGNGSDGLSVSQANGAEPLECALANGSSDKDISSPVDEVRSEKTDDVSARDHSAKISLKSFVVDETRRKTYHALEDQRSSDSDPTFDVFCAEPKELISVGLHSEHSYARSLARFAGSLGARGWKIASERIQQTLPAEVRFGRGWVGEYEPPLTPILAVQDQLRSQVSSDANIQRKTSFPRDNERLRPKESTNPKDMSLSLLNRITTVSNVIGVSGSLESPEYKPRLLSLPRLLSSTAAMATDGAALADPKKNVLTFDTEEDVAVALAKYTAELSAKFAAERGAFTVVLSGGTLIETLRKLAEPPYLGTVDWSKWHVFWVDERVVRKDHVDSNYKLAVDGLLSKVPIPTGQVYAINDALSAEGAAADYEAVLKQLVKNGVLAMSTATGFPRFDLMLLGMGPDGHIASLFPGHALLNENQKWVTHIMDSPKPPPQRITFTFPVIKSSAYVAMVVTGPGEAGTVKKALSDEKTFPLLPVEMAILQDGEFTWFTDKAAVSML